MNSKETELDPKSFLPSLRFLHRRPQKNHMKGTHQPIKKHTMTDAEIQLQIQQEHIYASNQKNIAEQILMLESRAFQQTSNKWH